MRLREVLHTCANEKVAGRVLSLGGPFAAVADTAAKRGVPLGLFVAALARHFENQAGTCVWTQAEQAIAAPTSRSCVILAQGLLRDTLQAASAEGERRADRHTDILSTKLRVGT